MSNHCICTLLLFLICLTYSSVCQARSLASHCKSAIYSDTSFSQPADQFNIYDEVYLRINCEALPKGTHKISTQWMDEQGRLQSERVHTVKIGFPRGHSATFKFKQLPQGSIKRMTSGDDFEDHQYGRWSVLIFINNEEIGRTFFTILD